MPDAHLLIDSAIEIIKRGDGTPELREAATKTANVRTVTLDVDTLAMIDELRRVREPYGPRMFGLGPDPGSRLSRTAARSARVTQSFQRGRIPR